MAIQMVRIPSETPNISNLDDFVGLRYAYGNKNGYVIGKGNECNADREYRTLKINSGRLVLQGIECDIDGTVDITFDNVAGTLYNTIYLQINLATTSVEILTLSDSDNFPVVDSGDDLTANTIGTARMELFHVESVQGFPMTPTKVVKGIEYSSTQIETLTTQIQTIDQKTEKIKAYDISVSGTSASGTSITVTIPTTKFKLYRYGDYLYKFTGKIQRVTGDIETPIVFDVYARKSSGATYQYIYNCAPLYLPVTYSSSTAYTKVFVEVTLSDKGTQGLDVIFSIINPSSTANLGTSNIITIDKVYEMQYPKA